MPKSPLFSTYRQGENRVTSSILAVLERIDVSLVEHLLASASGESSLSVVRFTNQVTGPSSVPDGEISASCRYLFEVKTVRNAVDESQLRNHLATLIGNHRDERLFVLSPDAVTPVQVAALADARVVWFNFRSLSDAIENLVTDPLELTSEQTRFLLRELQALFKQDGLLDFDDTVVVAARTAWPEYQKYSAYICQPNRSFQRGLRALAFYTDGAIQPLIPAILGQLDNVRFDRPSAETFSGSQDSVEQMVGAVIRRALDDRIRADGDLHQIFVLTAPDDERTLRLEAPIRNAGSTPWTQGQRYTRLELLRRGPTDTSALISS